MLSLNGSRERCNHRFPRADADDPKSASTPHQLDLLVVSNAPVVICSELFFPFDFF